MGIKRKKHESDSSERTGKDGNRALGSFTRNFIKNVTRTFFFFLLFFPENEARLAHCRHTFHRISNEKENGTCLSQMWTSCDWMRIIFTVVSNSREKWEDYIWILYIEFEKEEDRESFERRNCILWQRNFINLYPFTRWSFVLVWWMEFCQ